MTEEQLQEIRSHLSSLVDLLEEYSGLPSGDIEGAFLNARIGPISTLDEIIYPEWQEGDKP